MTYLKHYWWMSREENVNKAILQGPMVRQDDVNQIKWYKMVLARAVARLVARQKWISDAVVSSAARLSYISFFWAVSFPSHKAFLSLMKLAGQKWSFTEVHLYSWGTLEVHLLWPVFVFVRRGAVLMKVSGGQKWSGPFFRSMSFIRANPAPPAAADK